MKEGILKKSLTDAQGANNIPYLDENTEKVINKKIETTPFNLIGGEGKYWVAMGPYRLTEPKETEEEVLNELKEVSWELIGNFIYAVMAGRDMLVEKLAEVKKQEEELKPELETKN